MASDPGGVLTTRHNAFRTAAFRQHNNVGFHSRSPGRCPMTTMSKISGLHTRPAALIHPASDSCYQICPRTSLLTCWLDFSQVGFSRLIAEITHWVTLSNFIPIGGNPNDLDLTWHNVITCQKCRFQQLNLRYIYRIFYKNTKKANSCKKGFTLLKIAYMQSRPRCQT
jgi:hypothetical protein